MAVDYSEKNQKTSSMGLSTKFANNLAKLCNATHWPTRETFSFLTLTSGGAPESLSRAVY
jgi:hypothetical protein